MFDAATATEAAPGSSNDDFMLVAPQWAVVLDGVSVLPGDETGCAHGVRWFVSQLAGHLATGLAGGSGGTPLPGIIRDAIEGVAEAHGAGCDLSHPMSPAATVAMIRTGATHLDWLVLGDASVSWRLADGSTTGITDDRVDHLDAPIIDGPVRRYDQAYVARLRNVEGGFWVASAQPSAADHALTGSVSLANLCQVGLYSDGVTRLVERYGYDWGDLFALANSDGPRSLIALVRKVETRDVGSSKWRGKPHDDATAVVLTKSM